MSKELKEEEIRELFLDHVRNLVEYWGNGLDDNAKDKLSGLAFSILTAIDGCAGDLPGFILTPVCSKEDVKFYKEHNMDYFPISPDNIKCDIAGGLHDNFYK